MNWFKLSQLPQEAVPQVELKDPWEKVESSFIDAIAYFPIAQVLEVRLKSGKRYPFFNVPREFYEQFKAAPSKGKFFQKLIKKDYLDPF